MICHCRFRGLQTADKPTVKSWLADYLFCHISDWLPSYGLVWQPGDIKKHIEEKSLVDRDWTELAESVGDNNSFVEVVSLNREIVGIIHASLRTDRYLNISLGVIEWLYVSHAARGQKIAAALVERATAWMQSQSAQSVEVFVTESNTAAVRCYSQSKFQQVNFRMIASLTD